MMIFVAYMLFNDYVIIGGFMDNSLPKVLKNLEKVNLGYNIKLRLRKSESSGSYIIYYDLHRKNMKRITNYPSIIILGDKKSKIRDDNQIKKALEIRQKFQSKYDSAPENFRFEETDQSNFLDFFRNMADKKSDKNYRLSYFKFINFYKEEYLNIKHINYALCEDFKDYLLELDITNRTANHYFTCFSGCLNYAVKWDLIDKNPAKGISIRFQNKSIERHFSDELHRLWETPCDYHDLKNGFIFSCYTGLRFSDILNLTFSDIRNNLIRDEG